MTVPLISQEIYLLARYSSLEYFGQMRDHFAECVKAAEDALAEFMRHLPPDYRSRPLHQQPDAVWGERVIPNMQWALKTLNGAYISLSHGDLWGLGCAGNVETTFASINRDYVIDWMPQPFQEQYTKAVSAAWEMASNIAHTDQGTWSYGSLSFAYNEPSRGPLNAPASWPVYRIEPVVQVRTGDKVPRTGIYLPDVGGSHWLPETGQAALRLKCDAGQPCPRTGWWFTPAKADSRRHFQAGQIMPDLHADYGMTLWQWDARQGD